LSFGGDYGDLLRRVAVSVDKILRGTKPADLPIEPPRKFDLVVNLKTAEALDLTIPNTILARRRGRRMIRCGIGLPAIDEKQQHTDRSRSTGRVGNRHAIAD